MKIALMGRYGEADIIPGPEKVARELYTQLKKQNVDVTFIEYFFTGYIDYSFFKKIFGKKRKENEVLRLGILQIIFKLHKEQYDIIHFVNIQRFQIIIFILGPFLKSKFISSFHGLYKNEAKLINIRRSFLDSWIEKLSINKSKVLTFPSKLLFDLFKKEYNFLQKHFIIPNGVDEDFIKEQMVPDFSKGYNFVYYNSFNLGLEELLNSFPSNPDFKLFVIGNERKTNKNVNITFVNPMNKEALLNFLFGKHFVIKSSAFDSFSIFTAECMSMGIIPIVSENTGIKDFIKHGVNGFIYESSDSKSLVELVNDIYNKRYDLDMISRSTKKIYDELYWGKVSEEYLSVYKSII